MVAESETLQLATVRVSLDPSIESLIKFEVFLGPLLKTNEGREVSVVFKDKTIDNKDVFYTDSNGLEML